MDPRVNSLKVHMDKLSTTMMGKCRDIAARCRAWAKSSIDGMGDDLATKVFWDNVTANQTKQWQDIAEYMENEMQHELVPRTPSYQQILGISEVLTKNVRDNAEINRKKENQERNDELNQGSTHFYQWLKADTRTGVTVFQGENGQPVTDLPTIHKMFYDTWSTIFSMHKDNCLDFSEFQKIFGKYFPSSTGAPTSPPDGEQLYLQAQTNNVKAVGGCDGITPFELKLLPKQAWHERAKVLALSYQQHRSPDAYYHVPMTAIRKVDKLKPKTEKTKHATAKDFRLISLFTALYRVESGAAYRAHVPWFQRWMNANMHGGIAEHESGEVSWDVQADIEQALINKCPLAVCLMDYYKYFDSMEPLFMAKFAKAIGINSDQVDTTTDLYVNSKKYIKIGQSYGMPFESHNGFGQGDSYSLMVALALVSIQFDYIQDKYNEIKLGSCVDDRNITRKSRHDHTSIQGHGNL